MNSMDNPWAGLKEDNTPDSPEQAIKTINEHIAIWYKNSAYGGENEPEEIEENIGIWLDETYDSDADEAILLSNILGLLLDFSLIDFEEVSKYVKASW